MQEKRLLIISRCSNPHGGADRIIADLCRELPSRGWKVTLGLTKGAQHNVPDRYRDVYPDLPIVEIDGTLGTRESRLRSIKNTIDQHSPDVVLSMRVFDAYEAVANAKTQRDVRLVVGVRAFEDPYLSDVKRYRHLIDGCVTSGKLLAKACSAFSLMDPQRVVSIAGGIHPPDIAVNRPSIAERPICLLYAGRIAIEQKRCLDLPLLLKELKHRQILFELDVAGAGPDEQELRERLREFESDYPIRFHGWVDRETLYAEHYRTADLMIHFAAWEGVTIAPREAMAHGVVPVISRFDGLRAEGQFIDGMNSLTFPVGDVGAAASCVEKIVGNPDLFERLSQRASNSQTGTYSFEGSIGAWDQALRNSLRQPRCIGTVPKIPESLPGRLTNMGIPVNWQTRIRTWTGRPVVHHSPGSEWPTSSGLLSEDESRQIRFLRSDPTESTE